MRTPKTPGGNRIPRRGDGQIALPYLEIAVELGIDSREIERWARMCARGTTFRATPAYRLFALEVARRHRKIDLALFSSDRLYRSALFENARDVSPQPGTQT